MGSDGLRTIRSRVYDMGQLPPQAEGFPVPMGRTGPGLNGNAPVLRGLGALMFRSVEEDPHLGHLGGVSVSLRTISSKVSPQAVQVKS